MHIDVVSVVQFQLQARISSKATPLAIDWRLKILARLRNRITNPEDNLDLTIYFVTPDRIVIGFTVI